MNIKTQEYRINGNKWRVGGFLGALLALIGIFFVVPAFEKNLHSFTPSVQFYSTDSLLCLRHRWPKSNFSNRPFFTDPIHLF